MGTYKIDEFLTHAIEIEENGQAFYTKLALQTENQQLKKIFSIMSKEEVTHAESYKKLQEQLPTLQGAPDAQTGEFDDKKHKILEDKIFNRLNVIKKIPQIVNLGDALVFLTEVEMDVVDYFENIRKLFNANGREIMQQIINEEKGHIKQLFDLRKQYQIASSSK